MRRLALTIAGLPLLTSCSVVQSHKDTSMEAAEATAGSEGAGKQSVSWSSGELQNPDRISENFSHCW